jgi:hypothetical protein
MKNVSLWALASWREFFFYFIYMHCQFRLERNRHDFVQAQLPYLHRHCRLVDADPAALEPEKAGAQDKTTFSV